MGLDPATIGVGASVLGGLFGSSSAKKAAKQQAAQADAQLALQERIYKEQTSNFAPYLQSGTNALAAINYEMGLGGRPTFGGSAPMIETVGGQMRVTSLPSRAPGGTGGWSGGDRGARGDGGQIMPNSPMAAQQRFRVNGQMFNTYADAQAYANANKTGGTAYRGFQETPGYQFQFDQGTAAANALAGARGGLNSGRTLQDLTEFGQGIANQEYGNYFNRLSGLASGGQAAAGNQANAGGNYAANASNSLASKGNAQSAGTIGAGNAFSGAANNLIGLYQYQNATKASPYNPIQNNRLTGQGF